MWDIFIILLTTFKIFCTLFCKTFFIIILEGTTMLLLLNYAIAVFSHNVKRITF